MILKSGSIDKREGINVESISDNASIYPTIVTDRLKLDIYGADGRLFLSKRLSSTITSIHINELKLRGTAIVKVSTESGSYTSKILIKE